MAKKAILVTAILALAVLGATALIFYGIGQRHASRPLLDWEDSPTVSRGLAIYTSDCAGCHGALSGDAHLAGAPLPEPTAPPHDARGHTWKHPDFALFQLTKSGEVAELCRTVGDSAMPQFAEALSDAQIVDVLSYIKSTWPSEIRAEQEAVNALYTAQNAAVRDLLDTATK